MNAVQRLKRPGGGFTTTYFAGPERTDAWIKKGALTYIETRGSLLIFRRDRDFYHLHHVSADVGSLSEALAGLESRSCTCMMVADLVGTTEEISKIEGAYRQHGFSEYTSLTRMARLAQLERLPSFCDPEITHAAPGDSPEIITFLRRMLDPFVDQIPEPDDIATAIGRDSILLLRRDGTIAGVLVFETAGVTSQIRYWYVDERFREKGIGGKLMHAFFWACRSSKRFALWVVSDNLSAIVKYQHYGFTMEKLVDRIMVRRTK